MEVTANRSVEFPKLGWAISAGETRDLPEDKAAQKTILAHRSIKAVKEDKPTDQRHPGQHRHRHRNHSRHCGSCYSLP
jgi:hypothetical protein